MGKSELIAKLIESIDGGRDVAAFHLHMSVSAFNDRQYEYKGMKFFSVDQLLILQRLSGTSLVAEYFADECNSLVIPSPDVDCTGNYDLYQLLTEIDECRGELQSFIKKSTADGELDKHEESGVDSRLNKLFQKWLYLTHTVKALFKKSRGGL